VTTTEAPEVPEELTTVSLMKQSKRRLAETIQVQCRAVGQLNKEMAVLEWQAGLLAAQRDELLGFLAKEGPVAQEFRARYTSWVIERCHEIIITDPRDVTHGASSSRS
jgi:hypothetical protein